MSKHTTIQVTIVDDSKGEKCDVNCGVDWSSAEVITLASQRIKDRFGNKIQLEHLDLSEPIGNSRTLQLNRKIKKKNLLLPILFINGKPKISGQFDIRLLLDAIEAEIESRS